MSPCEISKIDLVLSASIYAGYCDKSYLEKIQLFFNKIRQVDTITMIECNNYRKKRKERYLRGR